MSDAGANEKGAKIYIEAARILTDNGGHTAPIVQCQGQAVELALKAYMSERGIPYPKSHNLVELLEISSDLILTGAGRDVLKQLNTYYFRKEDQPFPSRYRKPSGDVWTSPGQKQIESIVGSVLKQRKIDC